MEADERAGSGKEPNAGAGLAVSLPSLRGLRRHHALRTNPKGGSNLRTTFFSLLQEQRNAGLKIVESGILGIGSMPKMLNAKPRTWLNLATSLRSTKA